MSVGFPSHSWPGLLFPSSSSTSIRSMFALGVLCSLSTPGDAWRTTPDECRALERLGGLKQIKNDLDRYKDLTDQQYTFYHGFCARRHKACIRLRVFRGVPYVLDFFPGYQSRHRSTLHGIYRAIQRFGSLPDVEVVIDVTDGELQKLDLPILVITHRKSNPNGILYPDFTFYSWPESSCPPREPSHSYSHLHRLAKQHWSHRVAPWRNRTDEIFWRGAPVDENQASKSGRSEALRRLSSVPGSDAKFMSWRSVSATGENEVPGCVGLLEQCRYRYLAFLAGTTYSSRVKYQLLCGSVVLAAEPEFVEWWTALMLPGLHYAPVPENWEGVDILMQLLRDKPMAARAIARQGQNLALNALSPAAVDCYWWRLLYEASFVLPPPIDGEELPSHARPLEDVLLWPDEVSLSEQNGVSGGPPPPLLKPPRETQDPSCFIESSSSRRWETCCDTNSFGAFGQMECWISLAVEQNGGNLHQVRDDDIERLFTRCCLSGSASNVNG
eukprot:TRINITY_DN12712_c1_g3_i1.p1 TRINITY_DN12712_c1_g3~~TRINITY_DN12712_c1_g3_i1.p1  ORF type:complete len:510 (+),score=52.84 TRINITY_DN12712_c1_g3_i1:36-1532(+)